MQNVLHVLGFVGGDPLQGFCDGGYFPMENRAPLAFSLSHYLESPHFGPGITCFSSKFRASVYIVNLHPEEVNVFLCFAFLLPFSPSRGIFPLVILTSSSRFDSFASPSSISLIRALVRAALCWSHRWSGIIPSDISIPAVGVPLIAPVRAWRALLCSFASRVAAHF
jgi:hypothetical protein